MNDVSIARNYAEALLALARKADALDEWGTLIGGVSDAIRGDPRLAIFLAAPQISPSAKNEVLGKAFADVLPAMMVRFLQKLVDNRRQKLIPEVAVEYASLLDEAEGRVHAHVTVAREPNDDDRALIAQRLSHRFGRQVVPHLHVNPAILGGVIVRVGDSVMDGSVRKRLTTLRGRLTAPR